MTKPKYVPDTYDDDEENEDEKPVERPKPRAPEPAPEPPTSSPRASASSEEAQMSSIEEMMHRAGLRSRKVAKVYPLPGKRPDAAPTPPPEPRSAPVPPAAPTAPPVAAQRPPAPVYVEPEVVYVPIAEVPPQTNPITSLLFGAVAIGGAFWLMNKLSEASSEGEEEEEVEEIEVINATPRKPEPEVFDGEVVG